MPCTPNCGSCCDPVSLSEDQVQRAFAYGPGAPQAQWIWANWEPIGPNRNGDGVSLRCINYDVEGRRCMAYESRPPVCRDFPWYGKEPSVDGAINRLSVCGYKAEAGFTVLPIVQVT